MNEFIKRDWGYKKPVEIRKTLDGAVLIIPTQAGIVLKYLYGKFEDILDRLPKCKKQEIINHGQTKCEKIYSESM